MNTTRQRILESFRGHGVRGTSQRFAVLEYLMRRPRHPTAEEIHKSINRSDPRASLATVYKALHAMARGGLVREANLGGGAARYESRTDRHHHFVCERCGRVEDIDWFDVPRPLVKAAAGARSVRGYELVLRGLCAGCS